jgi:hypothetical protein
MEIHIVLERIEPPAGHVSVVHGTTPVEGWPPGGPIAFTGWLGLLRVLYEVTDADLEWRRPPR